MGLITNNFASEIINDISLKVSDSGLVESIANWKGTANTPPFSRLYFITSGDPYINLEENIIPLKAGKVYLIPTGISFEHDCKTSMGQLYFHITLSHVQGYDLLSQLKSFIEKSISNDEMQLMIQLYKSNDIIDALILKRKVLGWVIDMISSQNNHPIRRTVYSECVSNAISYIQENLHLNLNISLLAQKSLTSESNLVKKFKREAGVPIGRYIDDLIIYKAEQLLLKSELSIAQISDELGFCDQFYFSRKFKARFGMPPSLYRRRRQPQQAADIG